MGAALVGRGIGGAAPSGNRRNLQILYIYNLSAGKTEGDRTTTTSCGPPDREAPGPRQGSRRMTPLCVRRDSCGSAGAALRLAHADVVGWRARLAYADVVGWRARLAHADVVGWSA